MLLPSVTLVKEGTQRRRAASACPFASSRLDLQPHSPTRSRRSFCRASHCRLVHICTQPHPFPQFWSPCFVLFILFYLICPLRSFNSACRFGAPFSQARLFPACTSLRLSSVPGLSPAGHIGLTRLRESRPRPAAYCGACHLLARSGPHNVQTGCATDSVQRAHTQMCVCVCVSLNEM